MEDQTFTVVVMAGLFGLCILIGVYAQRNERSGLIWFVISLMFTPLLAAIALVLLEEQAERSRGSK